MQEGRRKRVRYGVAFDSTNPKPWSKPWGQLYGEVLEQAQAAEALGYDHVWLPEHHFLENGYGPSQVALLAALAVRTSRARIGTWVLLLPLHNALLVAEDMAVVDNLSRGRLILGVGLGYRLEEFKTLAIRREDRGARMEEGIEVMRLAWTRERFSYSGKHYHVEDLTVTPKPYQPGGPPIWMASRGGITARRAARLGCSIALAAGGGPAELEVWRAEMRAAGRDPDGYQVLESRPVYVTHDGEAEQRALLPYMTWGREGATDLARYYREAADHPRDAQFFRRRQDVGRPRGTAIIGDPDHCVRELRRRQEALPATDVLLYLVGGLPHETALQYIERFAREVMPRLA